MKWPIFALVWGRLALGLVLLVGQQPDPERHDKYRDDPKAYCLPEHEKPIDAHGHECACKLVCADQNQAPSEDSTCEMYCSHARCACHPEELCEGHAG